MTPTMAAIQSFQWDMSGACKDVPPLACQNYYAAWFEIIQAAVIVVLASFVFGFVVYKILRRDWR